VAINDDAAPLDKRIPNLNYEPRYDAPPCNGVFQKSPLASGGQSLLKDVCPTRKRITVFVESRCNEPSLIKSSLAYLSFKKGRCTIFMVYFLKDLWY